MKHFMRSALTFVTFVTFALPLFANACPPGPRDDKELTFSGLMYNFNRYMKKAESLVRATPGDLLKMSENLEGAIADLDVAINCAALNIAESDSLLPSAAHDFPPERKSAYIIQYENWMIDFHENLIEYKNELHHLLGLVTGGNASAISTDNLKRISKANTDLVNASHDRLRTHGWCEDNLK